VKKLEFRTNVNPETKNVPLLLSVLPLSRRKPNQLPKPNENVLHFLLPKHVNVLQTKNVLVLFIRLLLKPNVHVRCTKRVL